MTKAKPAPSGARRRVEHNRDDFGMKMNECIRARAFATDGRDRRTTDDDHDHDGRSSTDDLSRLRASDRGNRNDGRVTTGKMSIGSSVRKLETNAYAAILKAMAVTGLTWDREEFLARLRLELNISSEEHARMREQMDADDNVERLRSGYVEYKEGQELKRQRTEERAFAAQQQAAARAAAPPPVRRKPQHSANRAPKITPAQLAAMGVNEYICKKVKRFWPSEGGWFDCIITDYNTETKQHCLTYDINTPNESYEWADISTFSPREFKIEDGKIDINELQAFSQGPAVAPVGSAEPVPVAGAPTDSIVAAASKARDPAKFNAVKQTLTAEEEALRAQLAALEDSDDDED